MIKSKQLYQVLRAAWAPFAKQAGFKAMKGTSLGWTRETDKGHLFFWFQADKWGWDEVWGSKFTLEFQRVADAKDVFSLGGTQQGKRARIGYLLEGFPELDELRIMNNTVIEKMPGTVQGLVVWAEHGGKKFVAQGCAVDPEPAIYGQDIWLHYYSQEDVERWAKYLAEKMPRFIDIFENDIKSAQGLARGRFDAMMGEMQSASDPVQKAQILSDYQSSETEPYFKSSAEFWLEALKKKYSIA